MPLRIAGHNGYEVPADLKEYVSRKSQKLQRYFDRIQSMDVSLQTIKINNVCDINLKAGPFDIYAKEKSSQSMRAAVDLAVAKLERQLKKQKQKMIGGKQHRRNPFKTPPPSLDADEETEPESESVA